MREPATIELRLQLRDGVLGIATPAGAVRLDEDVSEGLVERVAALPRSTPVRLRVALTPADGPHEEVPDVVHHHFAILRERADYRMHARSAPDD